MNYQPRIEKSIREAKLLLATHDEYSTNIIMFPLVYVSMSKEKYYSLVETLDDPIEPKSKVELKYMDVLQGGDGNNTVVKISSADFEKHFKMPSHYECRSFVVLNVYSVIDIKHKYYKVANEIKEEGEYWYNQPSCVMSKLIPI
ncbi:unnamed protein product [Ambrosiozyma monospora]|uniref:Unnamed protein product n=1 Tax=Ambrosiozyma monospora TaxID=43982 RepID=A0ACB5UCB9_AMBMO|nr:unnamed protein product [Ambrosiozyma monospora]